MVHSVGKTIETLRKEKGWTQVELAKKLDISDKAVSKWECEGGLPDTTIFPELAKIFEVSIDYLMTGQKEQKEFANNVQVKNKKSMSIEEQEKKIAETIHNGIINIDELLATRDFELIKKGILEHPIHPFELDYAQVKKLYELLETQNWKELFVYAIDNEDLSGGEKQFMVIAIIKHDSDAIKKLIDSIGKSFVTKWHGNGSFGVKRYSVHNTIKLRNNSNTLNLYNLEAISDYLNRYKQQIIEDASLKWDKEKIIENLTKEYFDTELSKGNIEIVIIKLCVRLEAVLRCDYHYEGDFGDMMKQYCDTYGKEDDGWGYSQECRFVKYLHRLRKQRNSIVHSEKIDEELTEEEIKFCIDYICNIG